MNRRVKGFLATCAAVPVVLGALAALGIGVEPPWAPRSLLADHVQLAGFSLSQWHIQKKRILRDVEHDIYRMKEKSQPVPRFLLDKQKDLEEEIRDIERRMEGLKK